MARTAVVFILVPIVPAMTLEINQVGEIINWIGFAMEGERVAITNDAFTTCKELIFLKEKDISELTESFSRRTASKGEITFDIYCTKS